MKKQQVFAGILLMFFVFVVMSASAQAQNLPWGPDFTQDGSLIATISCDRKMTLFKHYERVEENRKLYVGITISIKGKVKFYIFNPNPNSMSPITFSFFRNSDGSLQKRTQRERNEWMRMNTPNLLALFHEEQNDCREEPKKPAEA